MSALSDLGNLRLRDVAADGDVRDEPGWRALLGVGRKRLRRKHLPGLHDQSTHGRHSAANRARESARELEELRQSLNVAQQRAEQRQAAQRVAAEAARTAPSYGKPTAAPTRMTRGQYTKILKDEQVRLHMLDGKSEKEAKALARPASSIDELKERNKALRKALRDKGIDYRTDEQRNADDVEKNSLLDEVERLAVAGGNDGPAKRAGAAKMTVLELRKFVDDAKRYQQRTAERARLAQADAADRRAWQEAREKPGTATDRQVDYILNLLAQRRRSGEGGGFMAGPTDRAGIKKMSQADASRRIDSLRGDY